MDLTLEEHEEWRQLFLAGDERACTVTTIDGSQYWYLGRKKGYVRDE
jgi:hypothetical protein